MITAVFSSPHLTEVASAILHALQPSQLGVQESSLHWSARCIFPALFALLVLVLIHSLITQHHNRPPFESLRLRTLKPGLVCNLRYSRKRLRQEHMFSSSLGKVVRAGLQINVKRGLGCSMVEKWVQSPIPITGKDETFNRFMVHDIYGSNWPNSN